MSFIMRGVVMKSSDLEWLRSAPFELASVREARNRPLAEDMDSSMSRAVAVEALTFQNFHTNWIALGWPKRFVGVA
jgi:hypothetical protein